MSEKQTSQMPCDEAAEAQKQFRKAVDHAWQEVVQAVRSTDAEKGPAEEAQRRLPPRERLPERSESSNQTEKPDDGLGGWRLTHGLNEKNEFPVHHPEVREWQ